MVKTGAGVQKRRLRTPLLRPQNPKNPEDPKNRTTALNLLLARFHQAEIIIVKHLIQGRNNEIRLGGEPLTLRSWSS